MKNIFLALLLAVSLSSVSHAGEKISCHGKAGAYADDVMLTFAGELDNDSIKNATVTYGTAETNESADASELNSVDNSRARKYIDYIKFDLSQMKDTIHKRRYLPADTCRLSLYIPKETAKSFSAPVVMNCDQSGGSMTLSCTAE